jgi:hypothetical protein
MFSMTVTGVVTLTPGSQIPTHKVTERLLPDVTALLQGFKTTVMPWLEMTVWMGVGVGRTIGWEGRMDLWQAKPTMTIKPANKIATDN